MEFLYSSLIQPDGYKSKHDIIGTERAIKKLKDFFEKRLAQELNLTRVSAPIFVRCSTGINDNLNGVERPVAFDAKAIDDSDVEIVQSLAKWKRIALKRYGFQVGEGLYTDMNAIRRDEELDNLHSIYVDQWDWEKVIEKSYRTEKTLKATVKSIYKVFTDTEEYISSIYPTIHRILPEEITFITSQELEDMYPKLTSKEREDAIAKKMGAVFISQIGHILASGEKHDGRSPDYDDWKLNGDIIFWYPILNRAVELSSMGIRVDQEALAKQLKISACEERRELEYHSMLLNGMLPYTIGGGIGQSRICMFFLRKAHIGEVQAALWPKEMIQECESSNILLL